MVLSFGIAIFAPVAKSSKFSRMFGAENKPVGCGSPAGPLYENYPGLSMINQPAAGFFALVTIRSKQSDS